MLLSKAEADLERLNRETEALLAQREDIDRQLREKQEEKHRVSIFLEMAKRYDVPAAAPEPSALKPMDAQPPIAAEAPTGNRQYGSLVFAANAAVGIIRETNRPWRTRDLVVELRRRGINVTGSDPITNLSNRLGRLGLLRAHRTLGWHLIEWPEPLEPADRAEIIRGALAKRVTNTAQQPRSEAPNQPFFGKGLPDAAVDVLEKAGRPLGNVAIAQALEDARYPFTARDHHAAVEGALKRRAGSTDDVVRVAPGTWGLSHWYGPNELKELRSADLGRNPGRDATAHIKSTQEAVAAAKSRGVKFGRRGLLTPDQMENVRILLSEGEKPKDIAKVFGVVPNTVQKWASRFVQEAKEQAED